jgi:hypothetical protein
MSLVAAYGVTRVFTVSILEDKGVRIGAEKRHSGERDGGEKAQGEKAQGVKVRRTGMGEMARGDKVRRKGKGERHP